MKRSEVSKLLSLAAAYDRRTIGEVDVEAWHELLSHIDSEDARRAVLAHYADETRWIMPADVLRGVRKIRAERADRNGGAIGAGMAYEIPDADPDDEAAYRAALREQRRRAGNGEALRRPNLVSLVSSGAERLAIERTTMVRPSYDPYSVPCPYCEADARKSCVAKGSDQRLVDVHDSRVTAAKAAR